MGPLTERIWAKIDQRGPDECWPWLAAVDQDGYGKVRDSGQRDRRAHAVALEEATGELAQGRDAMHSCDNPPCCNPAHLSWGTKQDNRQDCVHKQRQARGERHGSAKLTQPQVDTIRRRHRRLCRNNGTLALAREFGVNKNTIDRIVNGHGWSK